MSADILPFPVPAAKSQETCPHCRLVILTDARVPSRPDLSVLDLYRDDDVALICIVRGFREHDDDWTMRARLLCEHIDSFNEGHDDAPA